MATKTTYLTLGPFLANFEYIVLTISSLDSTDDFLYISSSSPSQQYLSESVGIPDGLTFKLNLSNILEPKLNLQYASYNPTFPIRKDPPPYYYFQKDPTGQTQNCKFIGIDPEDTSNLFRVAFESFIKPNVFLWRETAQSKYQLTFNSIPLSRNLLIKPPIQGCK